MNSQANSNRRDSMPELTHHPELAEGSLVRDRHTQQLVRTLGKPNRGPRPELLRQATRHPELAEGSLVRKRQAQKPVHTLGEPNRGLRPELLRQATRHPELAEGSLVRKRQAQKPVHTLGEPNRGPRPELLRQATRHPELVEGSLVRKRHAQQFVRTLGKPNRDSRAALRRQGILHFVQNDGRGCFHSPHATRHPELVEGSLVRKRHAQQLVRTLGKSNRDSRAALRRQGILHFVQNDGRGCFHSPQATRHPELVEGSLVRKRQAQKPVHTLGEPNRGRRSYAE